MGLQHVVPDVLTSTYFVEFWETSTLLNTLGAKPEAFMTLNSHDVVPIAPDH